MYKHYVKDNNDGTFTVFFYKNDELLIVQPYDEQGNSITKDNLQKVIDYLYKSVVLDEQNKKKQLMEELYNKTYQYILTQYPEDKQKSDISDEMFWSAFLIAKTNKTVEELMKEIYSYVANIVDKKITINDLISILPKDYVTFGIDPIWKSKKISSFINPIKLDHIKILPSSIFISIGYGGKILECKDDGNGSIIRNDINEVIATINYDDGIITIDETKLDKEVINSIDVKYQTYFLIPLHMAYMQLIKIAIRVSFVQSVKFRYRYIINLISNMTVDQLANVDIDNLIETYYPKLEI